jgi:hypothetical protein
MLITKSITYNAIIYDSMRGRNFLDNWRVYDIIGRKITDLYDITVDHVY